MDGKPDYLQKLNVSEGLYRSQILQVNMRWKALAEIYKCTPLHRSLSLLFCLKFAKLFCQFFKPIFGKQAPFGTASQISAARVRGLVEMLRTCEVHSSKPSSNEALCGISILLLREIFSVLNDEEIHR